MDPDAALDDLREIVEAVENGTSVDHAVLLNMMVEKFSALDTWLSNGGFAPGPWGVS